MDTLPSELLELIVRHCDHSSQKDLRTLNHELHDLATPSVFEHFYIAPCIFGEALQKLESLTQSKAKLSTHIETVTFAADILPPWDRQEFEVKAAKHLQIPTVDVPEDDSNADVIAIGKAVKAANEKALAAAWRAFEALRTQEKEWFNDNTFCQRLLNEALSFLPNLTHAVSGTVRSFHSITVWPSESITAHLPPWEALKRHILLSPDDWMFDWVVRYGSNAERMAATTRATLNLLEALGFRSSFAGVTHVRDLKVHMLNSGRWKTFMTGNTANDSTIINFSPQLESRFQTLLSAFTHLTDLDLTIQIPASPAFGSQNVAEADRLFALGGREITEILSQARSLKRLSFAYDNRALSFTRRVFWEPSEEYRHPLLSLFKAPTTYWSKLEYLNLSTDMPYTLLLPWLASLSPTLRRLELHDMCVGDVQPFFAELPKVVKLEEIQLKCMWTKEHLRNSNTYPPPTTCILRDGLDVDEPYERGLMAYLLGQADNLPNWPRRDFWAVVEE